METQLTHRSKVQDGPGNNNAVLTQKNGHGKGKPAIRRSNSMFLLDTTHKDDVSHVFHGRHIETGYRQTDHPWTGYLLSIFQLHNETMNVWTHLCALFMVLYKMWHYSQDMDFFNDPYMWPFLFMVMTTMTLYICSTIAHCFHSKSVSWHYTCFMLDYIGIAIHCFGSTVAHFFYSAEMNFFTYAFFWFVEVGSVLSVGVCFCCCLAEVLHSKSTVIATTLLKLCSVGLAYFWLALPLVHQLHNCFAHNYKCDESIPLHLAQIVWFTLGGLFFGSAIPERFLPGKFDIFGHSHQIFHICVIMTTYCQFEAVIIDIRNEHVDIRSRPEPNVFNIFAYGFLIFLYEIIIVKVFREFVNDRLSRVSPKKLGIQNLPW